MSGQQSPRSRRRIAEWLRSWRRIDFVGLLLFAVGSAVILYAFHIQRKYWVNLPIWDEWDTPGGMLVRFAQHQLGWSDLMSQHNESRKFFPRLLYIALTQLFGWDVRHGMALTLLSSCGLSAFALRYLKRPDRGVGRSVLFAWLLVNAALFVPSQYENFLCGNQFEILIPVLALFASISINLSQRPLWRKAGWNALLALVATYSFAHGMLLWVLVVPLSTPESAWRSPGMWIRQNYGPYLFYGFGGVAAISYYFVGYERPPTSPPMAGPADIPRLLDFFIVWLGAPWRSAMVDARPSGSLLAAALVAAVALSAVFLARNRPSWRLYYPWLLLGAFACGSGMVTALGRLHIGTEAVFAAGFDGISAYRYYLSSVLADVAIVGLVYRLWRDWIRHSLYWNHRFEILITVAVTLLAVGWRATLEAEWTRLPSFYENRARAKAAVIWSRELPTNPDLFLAYPYTETLPERIAEMRRLGLLKLPRIPDEVAQVIRHVPVGETAGVGALDLAEVQPNGRLRVRGWARNPDRNTRVDSVVFGWIEGDASFHPFTTVPVGYRRDDLADVFNSRSMGRAGFDQEINLVSLPRRPLTIRAWSVDLKHARAFPMAAEIPVSIQ